MEESLKQLLQSHRVKVLSDEESDIQQITVRRNHIMEDALLAVKRSGFHFSYHLRVTFVGEPAVDAGGPCREFFRLVLGELLSNNSLFQGAADCHLPRHSMRELEKSTFKLVGQLISLALMNDGPGPHCFAPPMVDYLFRGLHHVSAIPEHIPDNEVKSLVKKVSTFILIKY